MNNDEVLLKEIYKNAVMGTGTLHHLIESVEKDTSGKHRKILDDLRGQLRGYSGFKDKAAEMMREHGTEAERETKLQDMSASMGVRMNLMLDSTPSHIAEMVIKGSNMGIVDMTKTLNANKNHVDIATKSLADGMIQFEQNNVETLKQYL